MFNRLLEYCLKGVVRQGHSLEYLRLFYTIISIHRDTFTEENLPTAEDSILDMVNRALDKMWETEGCVRDMSVYKSFIKKRDDALEAAKKDAEAAERQELDRLLKKYGCPDTTSTFPG